MKPCLILIKIADAYLQMVYIKHMYKSSHYFHADVIKFIGGKILSTDSWTGWFQYTPLNFVSGGIKMLLLS